MWELGQRSKAEHGQGTFCTYWTPTAPFAPQKAYVLCSLSPGEPWDRSFYWRGFKIQTRSSCDTLGTCHLPDSKRDRLSRLEIPRSDQKALISTCDSKYIFKKYKISLKFSVIRWISKADRIKHISEIFLTGTWIVLTLSITNYTRRIPLNSDIPREIWDALSKPGTQIVLH